MIADLGTLAGYALREALRRRVVAVVLVLTAAFLGLYAWGTDEAFEAVASEAGSGPVALDERALAGATLLGSAMFVTLLLAVVLGAFLTLGAVRGDAEQGLLQPLVVRPVGRTTLLAGRFAAAAAICAPYVLGVYAGAVVITGAIGGFWPGRPVAAGLALAAAALTVVAVSVLGSTLFTTTANGIFTFMAYGAGITGGLLGQIADAVESETLDEIATVVAWALPFEALYQDALSSLVAGLDGVTGVVVQLGLFGGSEDAPAALWPWAAAWSLALLAAGAARFRRMDL